MGKKSKRRGAKSKTNKGGDAAAREAMPLTVPVGPAAGTEADRSAIGFMEEQCLWVANSTRNTPNISKANLREYLDQAMAQYEFYRDSEPENPLNDCRLECFSGYSGKLMVASFLFVMSHHSGKFKNKPIDLDFWKKFNKNLDRDKEILIRIGDGEDSSHPIYVAQAHYVLGQLFLNMDSNLDKAYWHLTSSLEVCDKFIATKSCNNGKRLSPNLEPIPSLDRFDGAFARPQTVSEYMAHIRQCAETSVEWARSKFTIPGDSCDYCKESRAENAKLSIFACARCHRFYYCSRKCQASHWKLSHKQECRKDGEFRTGDFVYLKKTCKRVPPTDVIMVLMLEDARWLVSTDGAKWALIPEKELYVRPAMYRLVLEGTTNGQLEQTGAQIIKAFGKKLLSDFSRQRLLLETNPDISMAELAKVVTDDLVQKYEFPPDVAEAVVHDKLSTRRSQ